MLVNICFITTFCMTWTWGHAQASASINTKVVREWNQGKWSGWDEKKISMRPLWLSSVRYVRRMQKVGRRKGALYTKTETIRNYSRLWTWEWIWWMRLRGSCHRPWTSLALSNSSMVTCCDRWVSNSFIAMPALFHMTCVVNSGCYGNLPGMC